MQMFEVGGCVRDEILGIPSKDIDFTVVLEDHDFPRELGIGPFELMRGMLEARGFEIFVETPQFLTIRARFPKSDIAHKGLTADFVLARKESDYTDGRRPDIVIPGTLMDDLARRDFTMNAIAKDSDGNLIDPFGGIQDIENKTIRAVGNAMDRIREDKLRLLRALRFSVTKGFRIDLDLKFAIGFFGVDLSEVAPERIREELEKMFKADTPEAMALLHEFSLINEVFNSETGIRLMPTMKG